MIPIYSIFFTVVEFLEVYFQHIQRAINQLFMAGATFYQPVYEEILFGKK